MGYLFALLVSSGIIKSLYGDFANVDLTGLAMVLMAGVLALRIFLGDRKIRNVYVGNHLIIWLFFLGFVLMVITSAYYTASPDFWKEKLARIALLTVPSFLIPFLFFNEKDIRAFLIASLAIFAVLLLTLAKRLFEFGLKYFFMTNSIGDANYLIWGSYIACNALLFLGILLFHGMDRKARMFSPASMLFVTGCALTAFILFVSGARAPTIFFIAIMTAAILTARRHAVTFLLLAVLSLTALGTYAVWEGDFQPGRSSRLLNMSLDATSIAARLKFFGQAWGMISERPLLGHGVGSYAFVTQGKDERGYPHNIILEIWCENGILAVICFIGFVLAALFGAFWQRQNRYVLPLLFVNLFLLLNLMKSSSLTDARIFFAYLGLLCAALYVLSPLERGARMAVGTKDYDMGEA